MEKAELKQLKQLLHDFISEKHKKYSWYSTDEVNWLIGEINDDLGFEKDDGIYEIE